VEVGQGHRDDEGRVRRPPHDHRQLYPLLVRRGCAGVEVAGDRLLHQEALLGRHGFVFHNQSLQPSGVQSLKLVAGGDGSAREIFNGKGQSLALPDLGSLTGPIDVQLRRSGAILCWGARFSAPFQKVGGGLLKDKSD
jgi:hypothetical protein